MAFIIDSLSKFVEFGSNGAPRWYWLPAYSLLGWISVISRSADVNVLVSKHITYKYRTSAYSYLSHQFRRIEFTFGWRPRRKTCSCDLVLVGNRTKLRGLIRLRSFPTILTPPCSGPSLPIWATSAAEGWLCDCAMLVIKSSDKFKLSLLISIDRYVTEGVPLRKELTEETSSTQNVTWI